MGKIAIIFKVYPEDNALDKALKNIKEKMAPKSMQEQEVAFGIKLIRVLFVLEDEDKAASKLEDALKQIDGVREVEVEEESLL
jgi:translation elongation factor aEF-1 beta